MGAAINSAAIVVAVVVGSAVVALGGAMVWIQAVKPRLRRRYERAHFRKKLKDGPPRDGDRSFRGAGSD